VLCRGALLGGIRLRRAHCCRCCCCCGRRRNSRGSRRGRGSFAGRRSRACRSARSLQPRQRIAATAASAAAGRARCVRRRRRSRPSRQRRLRLRLCRCLNRRQPGGRAVITCTIGALWTHTHAYTHARQSVGVSETLRCVVRAEQDDARMRKRSAQAHARNIAHRP
jgi:hypothetical protein